jgi:hypothetical protein
VHALLLLFCFFWGGCLFDALLVFVCCSSCCSSWLFVFGFKRDVAAFELDCSKIGFASDEIGCLIKPA